MLDPANTFKLQYIDQIQYSKCLDTESDSKLWSLHGWHWQRNAFSRLGGYKGQSHSRSISGVLHVQLDLLMWAHQTHCLHKTGLLGKRWPLIPLPGSFLQFYWANRRLYHPFNLRMQHTLELFWTTFPTFDVTHRLTSFNGFLMRPPESGIFATKNTLFQYLKIF